MGFHSINVSFFRASFTASFTASPFCFSISMCSFISSLNSLLVSKNKSPISSFVISYAFNLLRFQIVLQLSHIL